ncbi:TPA: hypothetical protein ACSRG2_005000 [Klebsiella pneumoniae]|uniref:hypothetical protein n=1 Tax=Klebsiella pneumoniae TaxID=573 RepID=UPI003FA5E7E0
MVKPALNFAVKFALFCAVMLLVAKAVPYDGFVDRFIMTHFDFERAEVFTRFISGEPVPESWESLHDDFSIFINTLISVPVMGLVMTAYHAVRHRLTPAAHAREWLISTARRFLKVFGFTFIFWGAFRLIPYDAVIGTSDSAFLTAAVTGFNLCLSVAVYLITKKLVNNTRSK